MGEPLASPRIRFVTADEAEEHERNATSLYDVIDQIGFGYFQYKLLFVCGLGWAADAAEMVALSFLFLELKDEWSVSDTELGLLGSSVFLGMGIGASVFGHLADKIGRKPCFIATVLIAVVFGAASALAQDLVQMIILRLIVGIGIGGNLPVDFSLFMEFVPTKDRGFFTTMLSAFWAVGELLACLLAWLVIPDYGWRPFLVAVSLFGLLILFFRRDVPESPRFLMIKGRPEEAWKSLQYAASQNSREMPSPDVLLVEIEEEEAQISDLLTPSLWFTTVVIWTMWFAEATIFYGVFLFLPTYLNKGDADRSEIYFDVMIATFAEIPSITMASYLVDVIGRKRSLQVYFLMTGTLTCLYGILYTTLPVGGSVLALIIAIKFFAYAQGAVIYLYTTEIYPTSLRGTGMGAASTIKRISGILVPFAGEALIHTDPALSLEVWGVFGFIGALMSWLSPLETLGFNLQDSIEKDSRVRVGAETESLLANNNKDD